MNSVQTATKGFEHDAREAHLASRMSVLDARALYMLSKGCLIRQHNPVESGKLGSKLPPLSGLKLKLQESSKSKLVLFQISATAVS